MSCHSSLRRRNDCATKMLPRYDSCQSSPSDVNEANACVTSILPFERSGKVQSESSDHCLSADGPDGFKGLVKSFLQSPAFPLGRNAFGQTNWSQPFVKQVQEDPEEEEAEEKPAAVCTLPQTWSIRLNIVMHMMNHDEPKARYTCSTLSGPVYFLGMTRCLRISPRKLSLACYLMDFPVLRDVHALCFCVTLYRLCRMLL